MTRRTLVRRTKNSAQMSANPEDIFPTGIQVLYDPADATTDICFIHGLTGNLRTTWIAEGQAAPWPETILPSELPRARIFTYGYNANMTPLKAPVSTNRVADHAKNLLVDLANARAGTPHRRLVFVVHSLGGIVAKEAILASRNNPEPHLRSVFECTAGVAFLGTPHRGSWLASWAKIPAGAVGLLSNKSLLEVLETDNQFLESVQERFWYMVREQREAGRRLEVACFHEELPVKGLGIVVPRESATLEGYTSISIQADHRQMPRFLLADDSGFIRLLGELRRWSDSATPAANHLEQLQAPPYPTTPTSPRLSSEPQSKEQSPPEKTHTPQSFLGSYVMSGSGSQFNAPGGTQNINTGSGNQFSGVTFNGTVSFGRH